MKDHCEIDIFVLLNSIESWDDWYKVENEVFGVESWPENTNEYISELLDRPDVEVDGTVWKSTSSNYNVDRESEFIYQKLSGLVFDKLEPEAALENKMNPEWYGKLCVVCSMWTRNFSVESCQLCGHELILFPLNEE